MPPSQTCGFALPDDLEALVMSCLEKDPAARPDGAAAIVEGLRACRDFGSWTARDAQAWWQGNQFEVPLGANRGDHTPLSNTALIIDMDERLERLRRTSGQTVG